MQLIITRLTLAALAAGLLSLATLASAPAFASGAPAAAATLPIIERFENFGEAHGIPAHKVHGVLKASDGRLWIGTWNGLCVREEAGGFKRIGPENGLSHKLVLCMVEDLKTGDLWVGTMHGLNKVSGGKITKYLQTDSGLPNNVVYGVDIQDDVVWAATAAGTGAYNTKTGAWKIYDHTNAAMHEPWCYSIKAAKDHIFIGVWGGGIVEHDPAQGTFKAYRDPDSDFHYDLVPDDGPINDITSWIAWNEGILWQCTYFGLSRYDGKFWKTWVQDRSPLPSNFTQFAWPVGNTCWIGHDRGASLTDGSTWINYLVGEKGQGQLEIHRPGRPAERRAMATALANGFVLGIWADEKEAWFATSNGLSRGIFAPQQQPATVAEAK
jgi:ligand-binding sensor domain-containing protein